MKACCNYPVVNGVAQPLGCMKVTTTVHPDGYPACRAHGGKPRKVPCRGIGRLVSPAGVVVWGGCTKTKGHRDACTPPAPAAIDASPHYHGDHCGSYHAPDKPAK